MQSLFPFFDTYVDVSAYENVEKVLKSTFLSEGKVVRDFEAQLAGFGLKNPVAVNSGTSALHLALRLANVGPGDEVILPAQTFVASALAILYVGAKPVFGDIQYITGNLDPAKIVKKITSKTKAIMAVDWAGYPCDFTEIKKIAREHNLRLIEDAAHAFGATYKSKAIGSVSEFTCFSFQAIKHLTTGDGGAVCTLKKTDGHHAEKLRWFGIDRVHSKPSILGERQYVLDEIGYKYHLNDFAAALGLANLKKIPTRLKHRAIIAERYRKAFASTPGVTLFESRPDRQSSWWLFPMHVEKRRDFIRAMENRGVPVSVVHQRIDKHPIFGGLARDLEEQEKFNATQIHLPVYDRLSDKNIEQVIESVTKGW
jgi:perosamine synthetase